MIPAALDPFREVTANFELTRAFGPKGRLRASAGAFLGGG
jgi:hypothetical protein